MLRNYENLLFVYFVVYNAKSLVSNKNWTR